MSTTTSKAVSRKPPKVKGSPLTPHANGQYCKRIKGKIYYFGTDHEDALRRYHERANLITAGLPQLIRTEPSEVTIGMLANSYLAARHLDVDSGALSPLAWSEYRRLGKLLISHFGRHRTIASLHPLDFATLRAAMAKKWSLNRLSNQIGLTRTIFSWGASNRLIDEVHYGDQFDRPRARDRRLIRQQRGKQLFAPDEIRRLIDASTGNLKAMVLLGINCAFGPKDCSDLRIEHVRLADAVIDNYRVKTGIERQCPLWPETIEALTPIIGPRTGSERVFLTRHGRPYVRTKVHKDAANRIAKATSINTIVEQFAGLKPSLGFYALRHTFATIAHEARDPLAVFRIMGHAIPGMTAAYVEEIKIDRLRAVSEHVRSKVLGG